MKYFENLLNYLEFENISRFDDNDEVEKQLNFYFSANFDLFYNINNLVYLDYKTLKFLDDKNFIYLCKYFLHYNKYDYFIKNNTQFKTIFKKDNKFFIMLMSLNIPISTCMY